MAAEINGRRCLHKTFFILVSTGKVITEAGSMPSDLAKGATAVASVFEVLDRHSLFQCKSSSLLLSISLATKMFQLVR